MSTRLTLCLVLLGCGSGKSPPPKTATEPPPQTAVTPPRADAAIDAPPEPAGSARLAPPQTWEEWGTRPDGSTFVMGAVTWTGGDQVQVNVMGTLKYVLIQEIDQAIKDNPDDPGKAIQTVLDHLNEMGPQLQWKLKK